MSLNPKKKQDTGLWWERKEYHWILKNHVSGFWWEGRKECHWILNKKNKVSDAEEEEDVTRSLKKTGFKTCFRTCGFLAQFVYEYCTAITHVTKITWSNSLADQTSCTKSIPLFRADRSLQIPWEWSRKRKNSHSNFKFVMFSKQFLVTCTSFTGGTPKWNDLIQGVSVIGFNQSQHFLRLES